MGSVLYRDASGEPRELWSANFFDNYSNLIKRSGLLEWDNDPAKSSLLENVYTTNVPLTRKPIPLIKRRLWRKLLQYLNRHQEFKRDGQTLKCSYDWRQSMMKSARDLCAQLETRATYLVNSQGLQREDLRYVFLTHSMGGLVVRIALALQILEPKTVDRIVHIGSPLEGAPAAFGSAYHKLSLPLLGELFDFVHDEKKNAERFFENLLKTIRTFPSIYQLMPPASHEYLHCDTPLDAFNPLIPVDGCIPEDKLRLANEAHNLLVEAEKICRREIKVFTIYGDWHQRKTDFEYFVERVSGKNPRYRIDEAIKTNQGDGSVPMWSAQGSNCSRKRNVQNVDHAAMCNNADIVSLLDNILESGASNEEFGLLSCRENDPSEGYVTPRRGPSQN